MSEPAVASELSIQSATGAISTGRLGRTLMHEHVFTVSSEMAANYPAVAWNGTREDRISEAIGQLNHLKATGIDSFVDMNVLGLGRSLPEVLAVAENVDLNIVLATGIYPDRGLPQVIEAHPPKAGDAPGKPDILAELFVQDIENGMAGTSVRAALIKGYTDRPGVTPVIDRCLRAVAWAHRQTGVPIETHSSALTEAGLEQQRVFREEGVNLERVIIGHSGDTTDVSYLRTIMDAGSLIASDRFGLYLEGMASLEQRVAVISELCRLGYSDRIVLSHDAHCYADYESDEGRLNRRTLPYWVHTHLMEHVVPRLLSSGVTQGQIDQMLIHNPRRVFEYQGAY
jgi:phosphotriesterase-related protein